MADLKDISQTAAFGATLLGGVQEFRAHKKAGKLARSQGSVNASIIEKNTQSELRKLGADFKRIRVNQDVAIGSSGVSINSKSVRIIQDETFENFAREAMDIITIGSMQAQNEMFKSDVESFRSNAQAKASAAKSITNLGKNIGGLTHLFDSGKKKPEKINKTMAQRDGVLA